MQGLDRGGRGGENQLWEARELWARTGNPRSDVIVSRRNRIYINDCVTRLLCCVDLE